MPIMLREIVREVAAGVPGIDIIAEIPGSLENPADVIAAGPDVVIVGAEDASDDAVGRLLRQYSSVRVLGISADGAQTTLYELRPQSCDRTACRSANWVRRL
jgi:hypothetical protein